jgi:hypothetical protein
MFVLRGGSIEMLRTIRGHSSVTTTECYSHLRPDLFGAKAFGRSRWTFRRLPATWYL